MTDDQPITPKGNQPDVISATGGAHKVEAVAGSGKTTTMVKRLQEEIQTKGVAPNRLLVLTFANEAAHTIEEKLRKQLGSNVAFDVNVYTYHSFSYQLLREYAYQTGLSPNFRLITEEDRPQVIESVYDEIDFSFVAPGMPGGGGSNDRTFRDLTSFIEAMRREAVSPADVRAYLPSDEKLRELISLVYDLLEMAHLVVNIDANDIMWEDQELANRCDQVARVYNAKAGQFRGDDHVDDVVHHHLIAMRDTAESVADHLRSSHDLDWQDYLLPEALFENEFNRFNSVKQTPMGRLVEYVHMLRKSRAFIGAYEAYLDTLEDRGALDYDELIHRAVSLLKDDSLREDIISQWDAVYCDEFQDTDESQLLLVEELRSELDIMVVGDSDQAIHEWRGQDPENMSKLPDSFEEIDLELNFRSRQPILDLTNSLDRKKQMIEADKDPNPPNVFKVNSEDASTTAQVSTTISHLLTGRFSDIPARELSDIAVLVRKNSHAQAVTDQLAADSIPYALSNDTSSELSPGLRTVLSYLRILVTPNNDISWQRVLLHLYRVPECDIDTMLNAGPTIPEGYSEVQDDELSRPQRVSTALNDFARLREISATHSVSELYRHLKKETKIEWFLRDRDREALGNLERLISSFNDSPVQSSLTEDFLTYLERQAHLLSSNTRTATSGGSQTADAVDIMTIHQAKGLDFDTVLLPFLTEDEFGHIALNNYQWKLYNYDILINEIAAEIEDPLRANLSEDQIAEEWRILHVALTRAKDRLFLFGNDVSHDCPAAAKIDALLPRESSTAPIEWSSEGPRMQVWQALMDSYDEIEATNEDAVRDFTETVNLGVDEDPGKITYYQSELGTDEAIETILGFADEVVEGTLADENTETAQLENAPLGAELEISLSRQHSHSALEAVRTCERKHVLDYVVGAFADPLSDPSQTSKAQASIGTLFHDVAELAYWRNYGEIDEWKDACRWLARSNEFSDVLEPTLECIDRYFETSASQWPALGAEVPIQLNDFTDVEGSVTGYVDSVRRYPGGGLAVIDYKTSYTEKSLAESHQLQLYVLACQQRFDEAVTHAGYVYVGQAGPKTQLFTVEEVLEQREVLVEELQAADRSAFENYTPGPHCQFCEHRSLGCPDDAFEYTDAFRIG